MWKFSQKTDVILPIRMVLFFFNALLVGCGQSQQELSSRSISTSLIPAHDSVADTFVNSSNYLQSKTLVPVNLEYNTPDISKRERLGHRGLEYTSTSNTKITITVTPIGGSPTVFGPSACTTGSCVISFTATPGPNTLDFSLTDNTPTVLSHFSTMTIIQPTSTNTLTFTANPVVSSVVLQLASTTVNAGTATDDLVTINALDADGKTIVGNAGYVDANGDPVALILTTSTSQSGGTGSVTMKGPQRITAPGQTAIYAHYDGAELDTATISATSTSSTLNILSNATITFVPAVIQEYTIPTAGSVPQGITTGLNGTMWFSEKTGNKVASITTSGTITEFTDPNASAQPYDLVPGPNGNFWIAENGSNTISQFTTSGGFTTYSLAASAGTQGIVLGPDGNLWATEKNGNNIAKVTPAGRVTEYSVPTTTSGPRGIAVGPDGNIWFTEQLTNKVGRITTNGIFTEYTIPTAGSSPSVIIAGPDGNLWFAEKSGNKIGKVTTAGVFTEYTVPTGASTPYALTVGPDGNIWFTESTSNKVGRITTSGVITEYTTPTAGSGPEEITVGPDGNLWFTEQLVNKIGKLVI